MKRSWVSGCVFILAAACAPAPPPPTPAPAKPAATPTSVNASLIATVQSSPAGTAIVIAAGTTIALSPVQIASAKVDEANFENSEVTLHNSGTQPIDLSNWALLVGTYRITFPTTNYMTLAPGSNKIVHLSSSSTPTSGDNIYLGVGSVKAGTGIATAGDRIVLLNQNGEVASTYTAP